MEADSFSFFCLVTRQREERNNYKTVNERCKGAVCRRSGQSGGAGGFVRQRPCVVVDAEDLIKVAELKRGAHQTKKQKNRQVQLCRARKERSEAKVEKKGFWKQGRSEREVLVMRIVSRVRSGGELG